jgi:hypothetical protein
MNIPEATGDLRPGERYVYHSREIAKKKLSDEQMGKPTQDGILVEYRGVSIISIDLGEFLWTAAGVGEKKTLREVLDRLDAQLDPNAGK